MLLLDAAAVRRVFPMSTAIEVARDVLGRYSAGAVTQPLRTMLRTPHGTVLAVMPAYVPAAGPPTPPGAAPPDPAGAGLGLKAVTIAPGNLARGLPAHMGLVLLVDPETGRPDALVDAASVTAIRTAAVSAAATDALARPAAGTLGILGSGVQARSHIEAIALVRELREIRVWSRHPEHARTLVDWAANHLPARAVTAASPVDAAAGADLVCTTTASGRPLLAARDVPAGAHINAIGSSFRDRREVSTDLVHRCAVFVDGRQPALAEAGDLLLAFPDAGTAAGHIRAEIGEVLIGRHGGRADDREVTLFKSVGLAAEDVLCGAHIVALARLAGVGVETGAFG